jgi:hypothetical protein
MTKGANCGGRTFFDLGRKVTPKPSPPGKAAIHVRIAMDGSGPRGDLRSSESNRQLGSKWAGSSKHLGPKRLGRFKAPLEKEGGEVVLSSPLLLR